MQANRSNWPKLPRNALCLVDLCILCASYVLQRRGQNFGLEEFSGIK